MDCGKWRNSKKKPFTVHLYPANLTVISVIICQRLSCDLGHKYQWIQLFERDCKQRCPAIARHFKAMLGYIFT